MPILKKVGFVIYNYYIHIYKCSMLIVLSATSVLPVPVHHVFQGPPCNVESEVSNKSPADLAGGRGEGLNLACHHIMPWRVKWVNAVTLVD